MSLVTLQYVFTVGQTIIAAQHNANFQAIYNDYNGNITDANIASNAAIAYTKLALANTIKSTDILSSTTFAIGNIPTGTTANKVVALDGSAKLPAVDGSQLTGVVTSGIIGAFVDKSASYGAQQATTDGFVTCSFAVTDTNNNMYRINGYTDVNANPTTLIAYDSCGYGGGSHPSVCGSITFPVRKNYYWKITVVSSGTQTVDSFNVFWIPIGT